MLPTLDAHHDRTVPGGDTEGATSAPIGPTRKSSLIDRLFLIGGIILLLILVARSGVGLVWGNLRVIGWGFAVIIGQELLAMTANTLGWRQAFLPPRGAIPFFRLFAARVAGDAINYVTPTATIGGEFVRARMIEGELTPRAVWASVAVAKISQTVGQALFIIAGMFYVASKAPLPMTVRDGLAVSGPLFIAAVILAVVMQRHGLFTAAVRLLQRTRLAVAPRVARELERLDEEIRLIYSVPSSIFLSSGMFFIGWMFGIVESYLTLYFLDAGPSCHRAVIIETLSVTIDAVMFFVPGKAGTQEGGKMLIFSILGLDPALGLAFGIARRIRELSWAGIGLLILGWHQLHGGSSPLMRVPGKIV